MLCRKVVPQALLSKGWLEKEADAPRAAEPYPEAGAHSTHCGHAGGRRGPDGAPGELGDMGGLFV